MSHKDNEIYYKVFLVFQKAGVVFDPMLMLNAELHLVGTWRLSQCLWDWIESQFSFNFVLVDTNNIHGKH